jgi:hypothetical protein
LLAVGDDIDAAIDLVADNLRHRASDPLRVGVHIEGFAGDFGLHRIEQVFWPPPSCRSGV